MIIKPREDVSAEVTEIAGRLEAAGLADAATTVREAAVLARTDPARAAAVLREASDSLMARVPAYSHRRGTPSSD